ncbi:WxL domain-containing protein [Lactiplantibacillus herbarum]|uniref:WxL domain-containing protein n=1 Tax=Lactiplantibacillus herbarum TaxID=1670446 RepID=UPI000ADE9BC1|nr:WxL domain-containing protein [Lactiplantibacillus herbarum]
MLKRPRTLISWLLLIGLILGVFVTNIGAVKAVTTDNADALKFEQPTSTLKRGQEFEIGLTLQAPFGKTYTVTIPEELTVDLQATKKANPDQLTKVEFDETKRELVLEIAEVTTKTTLKLAMTAAKTQDYVLKAKTIATVPDVTATAISTSQSTDESQAANPNKETTQEIATEPFKFTVVEDESAVASEQASSEQADSQATADSETESVESGSIESESIEVEKSSEAESSDTSSSSSSTKVSKANVARAEVAAVAADETVTLVTTYAELKAAYGNSTVTTIQLANDISQPSATATDLGTRTTSVTIDGANHSLDIGLANFRIGTTATAQTITVKNFSSIRAAAASGTGYGGSLGIVQSGADGGGDAAGARWNINIADLTTASTVLRLVNSPGNQVTISGTVNSTTVWESMVTGGVTFAANSKFTARKATATGENRSFLWFSASSTVGTGDRKVTLNTGAVVDMLGAANDTAYPAIYNQYDSVAVGTNATLTIKMYGNAYRAERGNTFTADTGSKVTFENLSTSLSNAIYYGAALAASTFTVNPGSELYITNNAPLPVFGGILTPVSILLNAPKTYDIKNTSAGLLATTGSIVNVSIGSFEIRNSNLSMWSVTLPISVSAKATYKNVEWIKQTLLLVTSSNALLPSVFSLSLARRINNTLAIPTAQFSSPYTSDLGAQLVTDADKKIRLRVITGYTESGGTQTPVYATAGAASVKLTDDTGATQTATTDASGYVNFTLNHFPTAGATITAQVTGTIESDPVTIVVQAKTPPDPVTVKNDKIVADQTTIASGSTTTAGNQLRYTVNGSAATNSGGTAITATAASDGSWSLALPATKLKAGDVVQIFVKNSAGIETPVTTTTYHDKTFTAAISYTVSPAIGPTAPTEPDNPGNPNTSGSENSGTGNTGELRLDYAPSNFNFGTVTTSMTSKTYAAKPITGVAKQWLQVSDNRASVTGWTVTARQSAAFTSTSGGTLGGAELRLPAGQTHNEHSTGQLKSYAVTLTNAEQPVFAAPATASVGKDLSTSTWLPTDVQLMVPGNTAKSGQTYSSTVSWTLTASVTN